MSCRRGSWPALERSREAFLDCWGDLGRFLHPSWRNEVALLCVTWASVKAKHGLQALLDLGKDVTGVVTPGFFLLL